MLSGIWRFAGAPTDAEGKNRNIGAQPQSIACIKSPLTFWKTASKSAYRRQRNVVQTMYPSNEQHSGLGACQKIKNLQTILSHLQLALVVRSPQTLHGDRAYKGH